jgi:hypothetical protein
MLPSGHLAITRGLTGAISQPAPLPDVVRHSSTDHATFPPPPPDSLSNDATFPPPPPDSLSDALSFPAPGLTACEPSGQRPDHYADYSRRKADIEEIFARFTIPLPYGTISELARKYRAIPRTTIGGWYEQWLSDPDWRPDHTNRCHSHRALTDEQEAQMMEELERRWAHQEHVSSRELSKMATELWVIDLEDCIFTRFAASPSYRRRFLRDHDLSMRTPTLKKKVYDEDPQEVQQYKDSITEARDEYTADRVWNMDETAWKDIQHSGKTVARKGAPSVPVAIHGDPKAQITAVCTISMSGRKLAPIYILRGRTERAVAPFEEAIGKRRATYSENSWMDTTVMLQYLDWLHAASHQKPCALVMDSFGAHFPDEVIDKARGLCIRLIPVPKGLTGKWQPLDRKCFGALKKTSQRIWREKVTRQPDLQWDHIEAARILEEAWAELTAATVLSAWAFIDGNEAEADDSESSEESEEMPSSDDADPNFSMGQFRRAKDLDSSESGPPSDGVLHAQLHQIDSMIELSHHRTAAHQAEENRVLEVDTDVPFHQLPLLEGVHMETTQANANARHWRRVQGEDPVKGDPSAPMEPAFPPPSGRRFDDPESPFDQRGFLFAQENRARVGGVAGTQRYFARVPFI